MGLQVRDANIRTPTRAHCTGAISGIHHISTRTSGPGVNLGAGYEAGGSRNTLCYQAQFGPRRGDPVVKIFRVNLIVSTRRQCHTMRRR